MNYKRLTATVGFNQPVSETTNTEENPMATTNAPTKLTQMNAPTKPAQIRLARRSPAYWRVTIDNPPINVMGPGNGPAVPGSPSTLSRPMSISGSWSSTARSTTTS